MNAITTCTAPRVPAGPDSLAAMASSRRAVLGAMAVVPVLGLVATPATAADTAWDTIYTRVRALDAGLDLAYDAEEVAVQQCSEACRAVRPAMLADRSWASIHDQLHTISLDQIAGLYEPPHVGAFGDGQAVADAVGEYRKQRAAFGRQFHVDEVRERSAQVGQEWRETYDAAIAMPVSTPAALAQKIELLTKGGATDDQMATLLLDAKRVAAEGR